MYITYHSTWTYMSIIKVKTLIYGNVLVGQTF